MLATTRGCHQPPIARLKASRGYRCADVVRVVPDTPGVDGPRRKFLGEHTHTEDEARFFVEGGGCFFLHIDGKVYRVACERGAVISIPASTRHWFPAVRTGLRRADSPHSGRLPGRTPD
ncbi:MAG TPA: hypothetical protein VD995_07735 [Azospirillum sp.]|nr:hypothetical protein [Azospirillum sp.]